MEPGSTLWDQAARWYDALVGSHGTDYHRKILMPNASRLLGLKKGDQVLDLACGQGVFSRYLFKSRYEVVGLDASEELVAFARERSDKSIRFCVGDAGKTGVLKNETFSGAACILALQNMEKLDPVFRNVARWLEPGGRFVMVLTHPCFRIPRQTHWGWDGAKKMEYRRIDLYSTPTRIPILTPPFAKSKDFTWTYHRPLQSYFESLSRAGLCVDAMEEWQSHKESEPGKRARAENRARKEIPLFIAVRAVHKSSG